MPIHLSTNKGNLLVAFEVLFPSSLTEEQKRKIKEVFAQNKSFVRLLEIHIQMRWCEFANYLN